jgi:biotin operon repressor
MIPRAGIRRTIALSLHTHAASEATLCDRLSLTRDQVETALYALRKSGAVVFSGGQYRLSSEARKALTAPKIRATPTTDLLLRTIERHS